LNISNIVHCERVVLAAAAVVY